MEKIKISKEIYDLYKENKINLQYAIDELIGYVDKKQTAFIPEIKLQTTSQVCVIEISDKTFELCKKYFKTNNINLAIEIMLWNNYFVGMTL